MSVIRSGNWSFCDPGDAVPDGSVIEEGNFSQLVPGTEILVGKSLTIHGGNWLNVVQQPEWVIEGGNWAQISRCSHLHPDWVAFGLTQCPEACSHVVASEVIGGITCYEYEDTAL